RAVGIALRALGLVQGGSTGEALLREAITLLEGSGCQVEHAQALVDLGAALRRDNRRGEARTPLRQGLELAYRVGAAGLVRQAQDELAAMGARPRKLLLSRGESPTPGARRLPHDPYRQGGNTTGTFPAAAGRCLRQTSGHPATTGTWRGR